LTEREKLVRLAATPFVKMSKEDACLLAGWFMSASEEEREALLREAARVRAQLRRRGL